MNHLDTPAVHVDLDIVERNIRRGVEDLAPYGIVHRPHIKVHKSVFLAQKQVAMGCKGVTCAKLGEAEVMADGGIDDILVAFPLVGAEKLGRYRTLAERGIAVRTIVNSVEGAAGLSKLGEDMGRRLEALIELDGGINRGGLQPGRPLEEFARAVRDLPGLDIVGLEYYGGDIYGLKDAGAIRARAKKEADDVLAGAETLRRAGMEARILSAGSSFSLRYPAELKGVTEVRAGNYIFNDAARLSIGEIALDDCALRVLATVVGRPDPNHMILDAGSKTLGSDRVAGREGFGYVAEDPELEIHKLNEEHGFVRSKREIRFRVGDSVTLIPNHSCVVPNLADEIYGMRKGRMETVIRIDARGKNR